MTHLIEAQNLTVRHAGHDALTHVDFAIDAGEIVTLIGPNGSGKTSLIRALMGATRPHIGKVIRKPGLRIGYVPQKLALDATLPMTVRRFLDLPTRADPRIVERAIERTGIATILQKQLPTLSGGQFQRVLLARAILSRPEVLILDEPTQGLDQPATAAFYKLLEELRQDLGCAILLVSHDLHVVMSASDRVICINGHICCEGTPQVVLNAPEYRALFGGGTGGTMALYRHDHDHGHDHTHEHHDA